MKLKSIITIFCLATFTTGCQFFTKLSKIGEEEQMTAIKNPVTDKKYHRISMPIPKPRRVIHQANSLWSQGASSFFKDSRAKVVGDILTININVSDSASVSNSTSTSRSSEATGGVTNALGLVKSIKAVMPKGADPSKLLDTASERSNSGTGNISRSETVNLKVAAVITQVLPNGNFVVMGHQETKINNEIRNLNIAGVIRPQDIDTGNSIAHEKIAELRLSYGGRGQISDVQQPAYGTQFMNILMPF